MVKLPVEVGLCGQILIIQGGDVKVQVCVDNEFIEDDLDLFEARLAKDDEINGEHLNVLMDLLKDLKS